MSKSDSIKLTGKSRLVSSVHDILAPGVKLIKALEKTDLKIRRIIPQHITSSPKGTGGTRINISTNTKNTIKVNVSMGNAKQSLMIVCDDEDIIFIKEEIKKIKSKILLPKKLA